MLEASVIIKQDKFEFPKGHLNFFDPADYDILHKYGFVNKVVHEEKIHLDMLGGYSIDKTPDHYGNGDYYSIGLSGYDTKKKS